MSGAGVFLLFVLLAVVGPLVLYVLVREERDDRDVMRREDAERVARRDTGDDGRRR
ncbi:hypothetical protein VB773_02790 [Haloarculaceae archaeon H-GB2-1]|nr:hypothetical protein [Haloarculaceae archaeon H-GB1-1]MEA5388562.1 hypothetical protein [Haloarculaceae archaeon H-GB11]MEA5406615.1 hypothetical protein [Haloarculaceae archaeon H-GB2-1]